MIHVCYGILLANVKKSGPVTCYTLQLVYLDDTRLLWHSAGKCEEIRPFYMLHVLWPSELVT